MNWNRNSARHWQIIILLLSASCLLNLNGCAWNSKVILTQNEMRPIIPKGTTYKALWDGKVQDLIAEADRVTMPKGDYLDLQQKADKCQ